MRIPFVGPTHAARSLNANAERSVNVYLEKNPSPGREWALYGTPGIVQRGTVGSGPNRGSIRSGSLTYFVSANEVYKVTDAYVATLLGTIGTSSGRVGMSENGTEVLIVDGTSGWLATSTTLTEIADVDFPDGVTQCAYLKNFFVTWGDGSQAFYINETPGSGTSWVGTDFASAEGLPDNLTAGLVVNEELWLGGDRSFEVFVYTGNADFPIERLGSTFIEYGTVAPWSLAKTDSAIFWLGSNDDGDGIVFRSQGASPQRISNHAVEAAIRGYSTISDAEAYCFQVDGHSFYVLTFPTADVTWLYDVATQEWVEWAWYDEAGNEFHRHRGATHVFFNRKHLLGDWEDGRIYSLEMGTYTDDEEPIKRLRRTQTLSLDGKRLFFGRMFVDMETGVANAACTAPQVMVRYSDDGGHTWSNEKILSLGATGEYKKLLRTGPTGAGRNRIWEISITDPVKFALFGADVDVEAGS